MLEDSFTLRPTSPEMLYCFENILKVTF
jgi:hypothetical protein